MTCTTMDHIYPRTKPGAPCYCGKRQWPGVPAGKYFPQVANTTCPTPGNGAHSLVKGKPAQTRAQGIMSQTVTLTKRGTDKSGNTAYSRPGVRASVYFNKQMFAGEPPAEIQLVAESLAEPGQPKPGVNTAERAAKAQERAAKAAERAQKAADRANKLKEQAEKFASKAPELATA